MLLSLLRLLSLEGICLGGCRGCYRWRWRRQGLSSVERRLSVPREWEVWGLWARLARISMIHVEARGGLHGRLSSRTSRGLA